MKFELQPDASGNIKVYVYDSVVAAGLNRRLDYPYGRDANFIKDQSEGIFLLTPKDKVKTLRWLHRQ